MSDAIEQFRDHPDHGDTPPGVAGDERNSAAGAQTIIERLLPDPSCRQAILAFFVQSLSLAHAAQPAGWGITLYRDRVRLSMNGTVVCTIMRDCIWVVVDTDALEASAITPLEQLRGWEIGSFRSFPTSASGYVDCDVAEDMFPRLAAGHRAFIHRLAARSDQAPVSVQGAHAHGVIRYLRTVGFPETPTPAYEGGIPEVPTEAIEQAFATFDRDYRNRPDWASWERDPKYIYAIGREGQRYPVKELVRIATGATQFDSRQARAYLIRRGYRIDAREQASYEGWIFQVTPRSYEHADRVRQATVGDSDTWIVTRYSDSMQAGDPVVFWLAGEEAGIYAIGELLEQPTKHVSLPDEKPSGRARETSDQPVTAAQVRVRYTHRLTPPLLQAELKAHPTLKQLRVIRHPDTETFRLTGNEWAALQELRPSIDGSGAPPLTSPEGRKAAFQRFRDDPGNQLVVAIRRTRTRQLQALLADPDALTLEQFNHEIWRIERATLLNGKKIPSAITDNQPLSVEEIDQLSTALEEGRLELHGNYMWRTASATYHPHSKDESAKLATIRQAAAILTDSSLDPLEQVRRLDALPGFGENTATGLVMVFHPTAFAIYNRQSREGLEKLGIAVGDLEDFQKRVALLRAEVGADDCIELDAFLYRINQTVITPRAPHIWWVNQGLSFDEEAQGGYLWAPLQDVRGYTQAHWKTMQAVSPGDVVVHYSKWGLSAVSRVLTAAVEAPRPHTDDPRLGRLIRTDYWKFDPPRTYGWSGLELSSLIPNKGPFDKNGNVQQGYMWPFNLEALGTLRSGVDTVWPQWVDDLLGTNVEDPGPPIIEEPSPRTFAGLLASLQATGLSFPEELVSQYLLALQTKRFVIFTGISGTGKTQLAMAVAAYYADDQQVNRTVIAVRPDWTDQRGLLGFYNPLTHAYVTTPFLRFLLEAAAEIAHARQAARSPRPFFVVLDEMNLARVEYYFADFLSSLESGEPLALHDDEALEAKGIDGTQVAVPRRLAIPENVFFTGTVNVDETTSMFSPKVLDRAFTIEFTHVDLASFGASPVAEDAASQGPLFLHSFPVNLLQTASAVVPKDSAWKAFRQLESGAPFQLVQTLHALLEAEGRHFGYRVAHEIARFVTLADTQTGGTEHARWAALDIAIVTKVLPKLSGTQQELSEILVQLFNLAYAGASPSTSMTESEVFAQWRVRGGQIRAVADGTAPPRLPRTAAKLWMMLRRLRQQGFASFIV